MALIRWGQRNDLFSQLDRMQREMEGLFGALSPWRTRSTPYPTRVYPALNIYDDGEGFVVRAEVAGVDPASLEIEVAGDTLTIRGSRKTPERQEGWSYHRCERDYGEFHRSLTLPDKVDSSKVAATCNHGILEVHLPHAEQAKARKIAVRS